MTTTSVQFSNFASTTLVGTYGTGDTALTVSSAAAFPSISLGTSWFYAVITDSLTAPTKREVVKVTNISGSILTVVRAQDGSSAQTWATGSYIELRIVNKALQDLFDEAVSDASAVDDELTSTGNITITFDSDNNAAGALNVLSGADTVLTVKNNGELVANPGYANIKQFGGDPTGVTDTKTAFDNAVAAGYTSIYFPSGTYLFSSGVSLSGQNIHIFGDGPQNSIIYCDGGASGFDWLTFVGDYTQFGSDQLVVENLSIKAATDSGVAQGVAIKATINAGATANKQPVSSVIISNVEIGPAVNSACFATGIELDTCHMAKITNCYISGFMTTSASAGTRAGIGIDIYSRFTTNNNVKATDFNIENCVIFQCTTGIQCNNNADSNKNWAEGLHIDGCTVLNCTTGIKLGESSTAAADGLPGWFIDNCHITATDYCVDFQNGSQFFFSNNLLYALGGTNFYGFYIESAQNPGYETNGIISNNTLVSQENGTTVVYSGTTYGVYFFGTATPGTLSVLVTGNNFNNFDTSGYASALATGIVLTPSNRIISGGSWSDAGTGNIFSGFNNDVLMANGKILKWRDTGGTFREVLQMYTDDGVYLKNLKASENLFFVISDTGNFVFREETGGTSDLLTLTAGGQLYGTALHNNAGAVTGTTNQYIASGTYTPTLTGVTNVGASTAYACQWIRVGNVVTVSGLFNIDFTAAAATELGISLPIASNFAATSNCAGTAVPNSATEDSCFIQADTTNDRAQVVVTSVGTADTAYSFTFQYVVL